MSQQDSNSKQTNIGGLRDMNLNILSEASANNIYKIDTTSVSESHYADALKCLSEIKSNNVAITQEFYRGILEAGDNPAMIYEAADGLLDGIRSIIDKFIALIKKIVAKFITGLHKIVKSDKYLKKNKDKIMKFSPDDEFEMNIFKYTYIDNDTFPNTSAYNVYKTDSFDPVKDAKNGVEYTAGIYNNFLNSMPEWYDKFRGVVLTDSNVESISNSVPSYTSSEYAKELYEKYRNGESSKTKETITPDIVTQSYDRFANYSKTISAVEKLRNNLEKEYKAIRDDIKNITAAYDNEYKIRSTGKSNWELNLKDNKYGYDDSKHQRPDEEAKAKSADSNIASIIKAKANQIDQMCTIHTQAFTAKLDAIKEAYNQDKAILYKALQKVNKTYYKNESAMVDDVIYMLDI